MRYVAALTIAIVCALSPLAARADGITIPNVPSIPFPDFGATFTNSTFLAALGTFRADLQNLENQATNLKNAPGNWTAIQSDIQQINSLVAAQAKANAARATQTAQTQQMQADISHMQAVESLSDSTMGQNQKLDVLSKMVDGLLSNQIKQRQLLLAQEQALEARQDAQRATFMGQSGTGTFRTP